LFGEQSREEIQKNIMTEEVNPKAYPLAEQVRLLSHHYKYIAFQPKTTGLYITTEFRIQKLKLRNQIREFVMQILDLD